MAGRRWWDPEEDDPTSTDTQDHPSNNDLVARSSDPDPVENDLVSRPSDNPDTVDYGESGASDPSSTSPYDSLQFPSPDKKTQRRAAKRAASPAVATTAEPPWSPYATTELGRSIATDSQPVNDTIIGAVMSEARNRMTQAASDPQKRGNLLDSVLADWQRESGRDKPNADDPTDLANFKKYAEDWMGVAKDMNDPAMGMQGLGAFRKQMATEAYQAVQGKAGMSGVSNAPGSVGGGTSAGNTNDLRPSQPSALGGLSVDPAFKQWADTQVQQGSLTRDAADALIVDHGVALGTVTKAQADAFKRGQFAPTTDAGRDRYFNETNDQMGPGNALTNQAVTSGLRPLDIGTKVLLATQQGASSLGAAGDDPQAAKNVASAISAGEAWADPALEAVARSAYYQATGQQPSATSAVPEAYVKNWVQAYKAGIDVPMAKDLNQQIREQGAYATGSPLGPNWKQSLQDVDQGRLITDPAYRASISADLTSSEAQAVCGPIAVLAFAKANGGKIPNFGEALAMAKQVGWTEGAGMRGITSEQELAAKMGVKSDIGQADPGKIAASVSADKPVIISTGAHYFLVTDYDASTGKFFTGATGRAISKSGGSDWMTVQEMDAAAKRLDPRSGGVNGALFMQSPAVVANQPAAKSQQATLGAIPVENLRPIIMESAQTNGLDPALIAAKIDQESSWQPRARSGAGAGGYTQLMPDTARSVGVTDVNDPRQNIVGGGAYLKQMIDRYGGDIQLGLAAYNAGPGTVDRAIQQAGAQSFEAIKGYLPAETQGYVPTVLRKRQQYVAA